MSRGNFFPQETMPFKKNRGRPKPLTDRGLKERQRMRKTTNTVDREDKSGKKMKFSTGNAEQARIIIDKFQL